MEKDPLTDDTVQGRVDPNKTMFPRLRSEEATGGALNTSEEVAQHLRRHANQLAQKTGEANLKEGRS